MGNASKFGKVHLVANVSDILGLEVFLVIIDKW